MTKQFFSFITLVFISLSLPAQNVKTGVLIIGNNAGGIAASIQSARSGAQTMLLSQAKAIDPELTAENITYLERIINHFRTGKTSAVQQDTSLDISMGPDQYTRLIKGIVDTTKNLSLSLNAEIIRIEKSGKGWNVRLKNGQRIKADVLVDATEKLSIASMLGINTGITLAGNASSSRLYESLLFRSTVATAYVVEGDEMILAPLSLGAFIPADVENFIFIPMSGSRLKQVAMSAGQAAGTIAAYCAFFKTTTKNINVRVVQGELFAFGAGLIPLEDISRDDPNFLAFQRMAVSGLLKPSFYEDEGRSVLKFDTAGVVTSGELRAPMKEFYSRSQIWFADNAKDTLTIEDTISLLMFTATRGEELKKEIEAGWKESFKFSTPFDPKRQITRKEFTILADRYLQPFNVRVDFRGNLLS